MLETNERELKELRNRLGELEQKGKNLTEAEIHETGCAEAQR